MPKYLFRASYTAAGAAGVLKEGGSARAKVVEALMASVGGTVESMYWAMGADDFVLLTAADVDEIVRRRVAYRAPGA